MTSPRPNDLDRALGRLLRQSHTLDPDLKRRWLRMLRHLTREDRARLYEALAGEPTGEAARRP